MFDCQERSDDLMVQVSTERPPFCVKDHRSEGEMTDIVERLRGGYKVDEPLQFRLDCANEIERLRAERDALLLLLEPFAKLLQSHNDKGDGSTPVFGINDARITVSDLRKARAAIDAARAK